MTQGGFCAMAVLEAMSDGVLALDAQWRVNYANPEAHRLLGVAAGALTGETMWQRFPGKASSAFGDALRGAMQDRSATAFCAHCPGLDRWFSVKASPLADGLALCLSEVTAQEAAERERERIATESEHCRSSAPKSTSSATPPARWTRSGDSPPTSRSSTSACRASPATTLRARCVLAG
jgi:nitrogen-specific signal transduction histidine kinase